MKRARFAGSRRKRASMRWRSRHSARSVRAVMPLSSRCRCSGRNASSIAAGPPLEQRLVAHVAGARRSRWNSSSIGDRRRVAVGKQARVQVLQQDRVDLPHDLGGAVVALHQLLARAPAPACRRGRARARARSAGRTPAGPRAGRAGSGGARAARRSGAPAATTARASPHRDEARCARARASVRPKPAARAIHSTVCRSRRPPGLSLTLGSRL